MGVSATNMNWKLNFYEPLQRGIRKTTQKTERTTADERGENKVATDKRPARTNRRADVAKKRSWQKEKGPQSRDACMQLDEHKAPVSAQ